MDQSRLLAWNSWRMQDHFLPCWGGFWLKDLDFRWQRHLSRGLSLGTSDPRRQILSDLGWFNWIMGRLCRWRRRLSPLGFFIAARNMGNLTDKTRKWKKGSPLKKLCWVNRLAISRYRQLYSRLHNVNPCLVGFEMHMNQKRAGCYVLKGGWQLASKSTGISFGSARQSCNRTQVE